MQVDAESSEDIEGNRIPQGNAALQSLAKSLQHPARDDHVSRQQAAERLTDIAYALTAAGRLKLDGDQEVSVPAIDQIVMKRAGRSNSDG
jgi:hypothetical protein